MIFILGESIKGEDDFKCIEYNISKLNILIINKINYQNIHKM